MRHKTLRILAGFYILITVSTLGFSNSRVFEHFVEDLRENERYCYRDDKADDHQTEKDCKSLLYRAYEDPVAAFTAVLTVATVGLFGATYLLWQATRDLVRGSEQTSKRQLRSYISKSKVYFSKFLDGQKIYVVIRLKNYGQTPAIKFNTNLSLRVSSVNIDNDIKKFIPPDKPGQANLAPGGTMTTICECPTETVPDLLNRVREESLNVYLFGRITYYDIFEEIHVIDVNMVARGDRAFSESPFIYCDSGNDEK